MKMDDSSGGEHDAGSRPSQKIARGLSNLVRCCVAPVFAATIVIAPTAGAHEAVCASVKVQAEIASLDIFQAARCGEVNNLRAAVASGVDITAQNKYGENILHATTITNKPDVVRLAIEHGVDVNKQTRKKLRTPLHAASESHQYEICRLLVDAGADPSRQDYLGREPLWYASWLAKGDYSIVRLLLAHGANPQHVDANGKSPLSYAREVGDNALVTIFTDHLNGAQEPARQQTGQSFTRQTAMQAR